MPMKDRTKLMFADELERMVAEMPLSKVRVMELSRRCGTVPQTFYYHFHDKYELVAWMYLRDYTSTGVADEPYSPELLERVNDGFEGRRAFYARCFSERSQNSIAEYIAEFSMELAESTMTATGKTMTRRQELAVRYHVHGITGMFGEWLQSDSISTAELSELLYERTPDFLKDAFNAPVKSDGHT